jgi:hypothetical protein
MSHWIDVKRGAVSDLLVIIWTIELIWIETAQITRWRPAVVVFRPATRGKSSLDAL